MASARSDGPRSGSGIRLKVHELDLTNPSRSQLKTLWNGDIRSKVWSFLCPLCHIPRKVATHPQPQFRHYIQILLTSAFFTLLTWKLFEWKGMVCFIPFWTIFEVIYRSRARAAMYCKQCGFDPYLFMVDTDSARREVDTHWRKKLEEKGIPYPEPRHAPRR